MIEPQEKELEDIISTLDLKAIKTFIDFHKILTSLIDSNKELSFTTKFAIISCFYACANHYELGEKIIYDRPFSLYLYAVLHIELNDENNKLQGEVYLLGQIVLSLNRFTLNFIKM